MPEATPVLPEVALVPEQVGGVAERLRVKLAASRQSDALTITSRALSRFAPPRSPDDLPTRGIRIRFDGWTLPRTAPPLYGPLNVRCSKSPSARGC
jgi:hypothetical protein